MSEVESVQDNKVVEAFTELRKFKVKLDTGEIRMAEIRLPSQEEQYRAERHANSVIFEKANGEPDPITGKVIKLPTRDNMMQYAKEKGMWTDQDEIDFESLQTALRGNIEQLARGKMKLSRAYELAKQIIQHRKEIQPYNQRMWDIYGLTADAAGEEALHRYLCVATAVWLDTEERIFPDIAAFEKGGKVRNQVLAHYMMLMRVANDFTASIDTEISFFRDYGFLDKEGNLYDINKKDIIMNIYKDGGEEGEGEEILTGFTDDSGNVIEKTRHPSFETPSETQQDG